MEYTKDIILNVNYGQEEKKKRNKFKLLNRMALAITKHKMVSTVVSVTLMLIILDFMLIASFIQVLSNL